jgi:hypothetical protein
MVDVDGIEIHPSAIDGRTPDYQEFLRTWGSHCGAPKSVFQGHLNALIHAEQAEMGRYVITQTQAMVDRAAPRHRALARLLTDISDHLEGHDCYVEHCLQTMAPDATICPARARLVDRSRRAITVLGLGGEAA